MDFFLVGSIYWSLIGVSLFLLYWGLWKQSWKALVVSGIALLLPSLALFLGGGEGWFKLSVLLPLAIFVLAYYTKRKTN